MVQYVDLGGGVYVEYPDSLSKSEIDADLRSESFKAQMGEQGLDLVIDDSQQVSEDQGFADIVANNFSRGLKTGWQGLTTDLAAAGAIDPDWASRLIASGEIEKRQTEMPRDLRDFYSMEGWRESLWQVLSNPVDVGLALTAEGLGTSVVPLLAGVGGALAGSQAGPVGGTVGLAAGVGIGSFMVEAGGSMVDLMMEEGVELTNAEAIAGRLVDSEFMERAIKRGVTKGAVVGALDAASAGVAGRIIAAAAKKTLGTRVAAVFGELGVQGGAGGGGEALSQLAIGEEISPPSVLAEFFGEIVPGIGEIAINKMVSQSNQRDDEKADTNVTGGTVFSDNRTDSLRGKKAKYEDIDSPVTLAATFETSGQKKMMLRLRDGSVIVVPYDPAKLTAINTKPAAPAEQDGPPSQSTATPPSKKPPAPPAPPAPAQQAATRDAPLPSVEEILAGRQRTAVDEVTQDYMDTPEASAIPDVPLLALPAPVLPEVTAGAEELLIANDIDPSAITGTGKDGRIIKRDATNYLKEQLSAAPPSQPSAAAPEAPEAPEAPAFPHIDSDDLAFLQAQGTPPEILQELTAADAASMVRTLKVIEEDAAALAAPEPTPEPTPPKSVEDTLLESGMTPEQLEALTPEDKAELVELLGTQEEVLPDPDQLADDFNAENFDAETVDAELEAFAAEMDKPKATEERQHHPDAPPKTKVAVKDKPITQPTVANVVRQVDGVDYNINYASGLIERVDGEKTTSGQKKAVRNKLGLPPPRNIDYTPEEVEIDGKLFRYHPGSGAVSRFAAPLTEGGKGHWRKAGEAASAEVRTKIGAGKVRRSARIPGWSPPRRMNDVQRILADLRKWGLNGRVLPRLVMGKVYDNEGNIVGALWDPVKKIITIDAMRPDMYNLWRHEAFHAMHDMGFFPEVERRALEQMVPVWMEQFNIRERWAEYNLTEDELAREAEAEAFAAYAQGFYHPNGAIGYIFQRIADFVRWLRGHFTSDGGAAYKVTEQLFNQIEGGAYSNTLALNMEETAILEMMDSMVDASPQMREEMLDRMVEMGLNQTSPYSPHVNANANAGRISRASPADFKQWFGDSQVTHPDGTPALVYINRDGAPVYGPATTSFVYGTGVPAGPTQNRGFVSNSPLGAANLKPAFLHIANPVRVFGLGAGPINMVRQLIGDQPKTSQVLDGPEITINPVFTVQEGALLIEQMTKSPKRQMDLLQKALKNKGYDGLVYHNAAESPLNPTDLWMPFDSKQVRPAMDVKGRDLRQSSNIKPRRSAATGLDDAPGASTAQRSSIVKQALNVVQHASRTSADKIDSPQKLSRLGMWVHSLRHVAQEFTDFADFYAWTDVLRTTRNTVANEGSVLIRPLGRISDEQRHVVHKAMEISQMFPGKYAPNENGQIVFVAPAELPHVGMESEVIANEVVILENETAEAYMAAQQTMDYALNELKRAYLSRQTDNIRNVLQRLHEVGVTTVSPTQAEDMDAAIANSLQIPAPGNVTDDFIESMTPAQFRALHDHVRVLLNGFFGGVPDATYSETLEALQQHYTREDGSNPEATTFTALTELTNELQEIRTALNQFEGYGKVDYVPFMRFGQHYVEVRSIDEDGKPGKLLHYEFIEFNPWEKGPLWQRKARKAITRLKQQYPDAHVENKVRRATFDSLRKVAGDEFSQIDYAMQFMSGAQQEFYGAFKRNAEAALSARGFKNMLRARKGVSGYSTDFTRGLLQYLIGVSGYVSKMRYQPHIDAAVNRIETNTDTDANLAKLARESRDYILSPEEEYQTWRKWGFIWFLGGNISSALLQTMSLVQFTGAHLSSFLGNAGSIKHMAQASADMTKIMKGGDREREYSDIFMAFNRLPEDVRKHVKRGVEEGIIKQQAVLEESGMSPTSASTGIARAKGTWENTIVNKLLAGPFSTFETWSRGVAFIAAIRGSTLPNGEIKPEVQRKILEVFGNNALFLRLMRQEGGITPYLFARMVVDDTFGVYGKGNRPYMMQGIGSALLQFQTYPLQMFEFLKRMLTSQGGAGKAAFAKVMLMLFLTAGLRGLPLGDDMADYWEYYKRTFSDVDDPLSLQLREMLSTNFGFSPFMQEFMENGLFNAAGIDVQRRISLGEMVGSEQVKALLGVRGGVDELLGVPGALAFTSVGNFYEQQQQGRTVAALQSLMPTFLKNATTGLYTLGDSGLTTAAGVRLINPEEINAGERYSKFFGFNPTRHAHAREQEWMRNRLSSAVEQAKYRYERRYEGHMLDYIEAMHEDDEGNMRSAKESMNDIVEQILEHNSKAKPEHYIAFNLTNIMLRVMIARNPKMRNFQIKELARPRAMGMEDLYYNKGFRE